MFQIVKVTTDSDGYFAVGNLALHRRYWVKAVEGPDFTAPVSCRISRPISSADDDQVERQTVMDIGHFALAVAPSRKVGVKLESPSFVVTSGADEETSQIQFSSTAPLDRHAWFLRTYPFSGWSSMVHQNQSYIERERQAAVTTAAKDA